MKKTQCSNGHWYDESLGSCPECKGGTVLLNRSQMEKVKEMQTPSPKPCNNRGFKIALGVLLVVIVGIIVVYDTQTPKEATNETNNTVNEVNTTTQTITAQEVTIQTNNTANEVNTTTTQEVIIETNRSTTDTQPTQNETNSSKSESNNYNAPLCQDHF
jgi:hypothetical protein